jgi:hypothetical protein
MGQTPSFTSASNGVFQGTITGLNLNLLPPDSQGFAIKTDNGQPNLAHLQVPQTRPLCSGGAASLAATQLVPTTFLGL